MLWVAVQAPATVVLCVALTVYGKRSQEIAGLEAGIAKIDQFSEAQVNEAFEQLKKVPRISQARTCSCVCVCVVTVFHLHKPIVVWITASLMQDRNLGDLSGVPVSLLHAFMP